MLHHDLPRDPSVRVSPRWADKELARPFVDHAVLVVYAISVVHTALSSMKGGECVSVDTPGGTLVTLYSTNHKPVAHGAITLDHQPNHRGVKLTPSHALMTVTTVVVPGYLLPCSFCPSHEETALSQFGQPPFNIVCSIRHLLTRAPDPSATPPPTTGSALAVESSALAVAAIAGPSEVESKSPFPIHPSSVSKAISAQQKTLLDPGDPGLLDLTENSNLKCSHDDCEFECDDDCDSKPEQDVTVAKRDAATEWSLCELALSYEEIDLKSLMWILSRLQGDPFHLSHQLNIPVHHGLRRPFLRALSAAMFIMDTSDKAAVEAVLEKQGTTLEMKLRSSLKWVLQRICHYLPAPAIMLPCVIAVFNVYGPMKDSTTDQPLFGLKTWDTVKNILENIRSGHYADPPGVQLYYSMDVDNAGLTLYWCCRGTNSVEGGVHQSLICQC